MKKSIITCLALIAISLSAFPVCVVSYQRRLIFTNDLRIVNLSEQNRNVIIDLIRDVADAQSGRRFQFKLEPYAVHDLNLLYYERLMPGNFGIVGVDDDKHLLLFLVRADGNIEQKELTGNRSEDEVIVAKFCQKALSLRQTSSDIGIANMRNPKLENAAKRILNRIDWETVAVRLLEVMLIRSLY